MEKWENLLVQEDMDGERLDLFLSENEEEISRSFIQELIKTGQVMVNGSLLMKTAYRVKAGDEIGFKRPETKELKLEAENIPIQVIYQDADLAVIDKPKGMVVHPAHGNWNHTLVNALLYQIKDLSGINGKLRPGIVHRLDKDTSGVMVVAKNDKAHRSLAEQIRVHSITREYIALVHGVIDENSGTIDAPIGRNPLDRKKMGVCADGRRAVSQYEVLQRFPHYTLVKVKLLTGRTHQIRVHFAYIKHPVAGDPLYGPAKKHLGLESQALHAYRLGFVHPQSGKYMEFSSDLPPYFQNLVDELGDRD